MATIWPVTTDWHEGYAGMPLRLVASIYILRGNGTRCSVFAVCHIYAKKDASEAGPVNVQAGGRSVGAVKEKVRPTAPAQRHLFRAKLQF